MKKILVAAVLMALLLGAFADSVAAFPGGTWVSGVTVANLDSDIAAVSIVFYKADGTVALSFDGGTIGGNSSKAWYLPSQVTGLTTPFIGSAVVQSDRQVAATVNTQFPSGSNPMRVGTSVGVGNPTETVYATQLLKAFSGWNSYCAVQNTGMDPVTVNATFYGSNGAVAFTKSQSIPGYSSYIFDQGEEAGLGTTFNGSAKFVGDTTHPLAVVCNFYNSGADANTAQFHSYNGMGTGGTAVYIPRVVKDYYNYQSGMKVQNISASTPLSVTVVFNFNGTNYTLVSPSIGPGQSWGPYMGSAAQLAGATPSMTGVAGSGSAVVSVNNPSGDKLIIATVNEDNRVSPAGRGVTYEGALASDATGTLVFPQVAAEYYGYSSGIQVAKVEAGTSTCSANYSAYGPVAAFSVPFSLSDTNPSWSQFAPAASGMIAGISNDNYSGAVTVNCTGARVIGISNLSFRADRDTRYTVLTGDSFTTARGINK
jgi:hypothetical protein